MYINCQLEVLEAYDLPDNVYVRHCNMNDLWYRGSQGTGKTILKCNFVVNGLSNKITATRKYSNRLTGSIRYYNYLSLYATKGNSLT